MEHHKIFRIVAAVMLIIASGASAGSVPLPQLQVKDRRVVDSNGSTVILRGVAVNQLGDYFQANPSVPSTHQLARRDFEQMANLGISSVRLIVSWSKLEPAPYVHDRAYLAQIKQAVQWAKENNIYVVLDMHQDAWGKHIYSFPDENCNWPLIPNIGWDGAPQWATFTDDRGRCMLVHRELSLAVMNAWQAFWHDREGIQQHLIDTWSWLAEEFKDEPAMAGYDILNEPGWGWNPVMDVRKHKPAFYRRAAAAIRKAEAGGLNKIIFFEPLSIWAAIPHERAVPFTQDPDIIYAPHIYIGSISIDVYLLHREIIPLHKGFEWAEAEAKEFNTTFWNGEWFPGAGDHAFRYAALEDQYQTGSARWQWRASCGDPHVLSGSWPDQSKVHTGENHDVMISRCGDASKPEGIEQGINPIDAIILARPYPRAFPFPATFRADPKAKILEMSGNAPSGNVPLLVWVPGKSRPEIESENIKDLSLEQVNSGWMLRGVPGPGAWKLLATGKD